MRKLLCKEVWLHKTTFVFVYGADAPAGWTDRPNAGKIRVGNASSRPSTILKERFLTVAETVILHAAYHWFTEYA